MAKIKKPTQEQLAVNLHNAYIEELIIHLVGSKEKRAKNRLKILEYVKSIGGQVKEKL